MIIFALLHFIDNIKAYPMSDNSAISLQLNSYTLIASLIEGTLRLTLEPNRHDEYVYISSKFYADNFPQQLQIIFERVSGLYDYLQKMVDKNLTDRVSFRNELLIIKVFIDDKIREVPIKMRRMREEKERYSQSEKHFMLTSISSQPSESQSRVTYKIDKSTLPAPRLKLLMMRENNKLKKALTKVPEEGPSYNPGQGIRQYPYLKPQTINRYDTPKAENVSSVSRKSYSQGKTQYNSLKISRSFSLRKSIKQNNMDLSNKELKYQNIKQIVSFDWSRLVLLNVGYNNIGSEGFKLLTSIKWPALKTLYACFNNILRVEWTPANVCFLKTLSLSGNKIKQIPRDIIELQFLQEFFIYNNKIEVLPEELMVMEELRNFSIYGNKLDAGKNKKILAKLKSRKIQVWQ